MMFAKSIAFTCLRLPAMLMAMAALGGCGILEPPSPRDDSLLDGPVADLTADQSQRFQAGDNAFNAEVFTPTTGLGPIFVAASCGSCHAGDGKGHPSTALTRFGQVDSAGNLFLAQGGPQLQHVAIPGFTPEQVPSGATSSLFLPPANTGLGYLELVPDQAILDMSDPSDSDGDGISGIPNYVTLPWYATAAANAVPRGGKYIGRFGRKAAAYDLLNQTVNAYNQDMGVTSEFSPIDLYSGQQIDPEVSTQTVRNVVFYLQTLKAPIQRTPGDPNVVQGKATFEAIGCEGCHRETLHTGYSEIGALSDVDFHPYTDMLLHDMGSGLDDGYTEGTAATAEWRTTPLWGLGLAENSQGGSLYLLHDGRARNIAEAILLHGGEAQASRDRYNTLSETEKNQVLLFLKSL